jgi:hypothetical protein
VRCGFGLEKIDLWIKAVKVLRGVQTGAGIVIDILTIYMIFGGIDDDDEG